MLMYIFLRSFKYDESAKAGNKNHKVLELSLEITRLGCTRIGLRYSTNRNTNQMIYRASEKLGLTDTALQP